MLDLRYFNPKNLIPSEYADLIEKIYLPIDEEVTLEKVKNAKRLILCLRVSKDEKKLLESEKDEAIEQKLIKSIETQKYKIDNFITSNGLQEKPCLIFSDIHSAKNTKRPNFRKMLEQIQEGDMILVLWWSRFIRNNTLGKLLRGFLNMKNIGVFAIDQSNEPFTMGILGEVDERELKETAKRVNAGLDKLHKLRKGHVTNKPPFGYESKFTKTKNVDDKGKMIIDKAKAKIIIDIFTRFAEGTKIPALAAEYNLKYHMVQYMLKNKTYTGQKCFKDEWLPAKELKIIEQELFDKVQEKFK